MKDYKLISLLKELSKEDLGKFSQFINSTYNNHSNKIRRLYTQIIKYYPGFEGGDFTKEIIYGKISSNEKYNDSTFRALIHELLQLFYKFLVVEGVQHDPLSYHVIKIRELNKRCFYSIAKSELDKNKTSLKNHSYDYNLYLNQYYLESFRYNIESITTKIQGTGNVVSLLSQLSTSNLYLLLFFITEIVSDYVNAIVLSAKYNIDIREQLNSKIISCLDLDKLVSTCEENEEALNILDLYVSLYRLFNNLSEKSFYSEYKKKIEKYELFLSREEKTFHYSNLINYLNIQKNKNNKLHHKFELFTLYEEFLRDELYLDSKANHLNPALFRAILINAIECRKYSWVEQFINVYVDCASKYEKNNLFYYGYSLFYYEVGKYFEALDCLDKIKLDTFIFKFDSYGTRLKIYFEDENPQKAIDYIHTYGEFIRKDKFLTESRKNSYKAFIKFTRDLIYCKENKPNYEIDFVKKNIEETTNILNRDWLLKKANELLKTGKFHTKINIA